MGRMGTEAMLEMVKQDIALAWHLQSNHYPPHPPELIPTAKAAIEAGCDGDADRLIQLPEGIEWRDGRTKIEAWRIIESLHLDPFIDDGYDEYLIDEADGLDD